MNAFEISQELEKTNIKEDDLELNKININGIPLWRLVRFTVRANYLKKKHGFIYNSNSTKINFIDSIVFLLKSIFKISELVITNKKSPITFFPLPRLVKHNDIYFDKFTDPVIKESKITGSLIFQRHLAGCHSYPRVNSKLVVYTDLIDHFSTIFSILSLPVIIILYWSKAKKVYQKAIKIYQVDRMTFFQINLKLGEFLIQRFFYKLLFKFLHVEKVFIVNREIFFPIISAAKVLEIKVFEFQHGITTKNTPLYTGRYNSNIDPDNFLVFGEFWMNDMFGMDKSKLINIGWAYGKQKSPIIQSRSVQLTNSVLVISSPEITEHIIAFVEFVSSITPHLKFDIRLHPQESLNENQLARLVKIINVKIIDGTIDSAILISNYDKIIGENSTVLYEALHLNKKVAKINICGLISYSKELDQHLGFIPLRNEAEVLDYLESTSPKPIDTVSKIYSDFDNEVFKKLLI